ncbi:tRNA (adenosine(37)-N6)-dimethylallyltransferase MiaA [Patescibacteria group bacterium]|nr:MAG: tRNA (adenosine(37)-N6)-dimethylallyltransferase MiaA [Patescibacteria group bacterium]
MKKRLLVVIGPTTSGKSALAVALAKKFSGEVVSADSRQVYKDLDIGTGKITRKEKAGIPHHCLDIASSKRQITVEEYRKHAEKALEEIWARGKLPIIIGGTGFYIQALVDKVVFPHVPPNKILRKRLEKKSAQELFLILKKLDPARARTIEPKNPRRLIRAIEIAKTLGKVPQLKRRKKELDALFMGIKISPQILKKNIERRAIERLRQGMIAEAQRLRARGLSLKRMRELGLEYRYLADFLQDKISKKELRQKIISGNWQYAKRQLRWFNRDKRIKWFDISKKQERKKLERSVRKFLDIDTIQK